ncbi:acetyl-CoA carboxylase biotin carboxyl carrier protein [Neorhizobium sp. NCHU2750]|uniref:acetyl-CoA carboxylase biotin carboxyl carrier protein n=1 Tax=Neorhizobium sp. NCHU2750 TaxID=1825976 RepID=UPI000E76DEFF|nr:acetyl-CoA carboxylase biotin carboxyl carrier protein [Neorhizobium sp. NCHU2750]
MDLDKISRLIEFVGSSRVSELSVSEGGVTVRIIRQSTGASEASLAKAATPVEHSTAADPGPPQAAINVERQVAGSATITAPSYGLFHRSPSPGAKPFVEVGDVIVEGQDLFIIEAMKVFNTVKADRSGRVTNILADDGQDVELDQVILEIA